MSPITPFSSPRPAARRRTPDGATGLPPGLNVNTGNGQVTGTPTTEVGSPFAVTVTVDRQRWRAGDRHRELHLHRQRGPVGVTPIADIQGTGTASPLAGQVVNTEGVVTARYPTGGLNGFYIQTPARTPPNASDAIFVYGARRLHDLPGHRRLGRRDRHGR